MLLQVTKSPAHGTQTGTLVDLDDAAGASRQATEVNGQGTVPSSASKPGDEDFDMFAQSRQSFEENLPRVKYVTLQWFLYALWCNCFYHVNIYLSMQLLINCSACCKVKSQGFLYSTTYTETGPAALYNHWK